MANTQFYEEVVKDNSTISWKDIFSESYVKHSKMDLEYATQTGTIARQVPESRMLATWHRPWLWFSFAKYSLGLVLLLYGIVYFLYGQIGAVASSLIDMMMIIPPLVVPMIILILMWELNIPQNISLFDLIGFFLAGAIICFVVTSLMFLPVPGELPASYASIREEPAKLCACVAILYYVERKQNKKIYGITGLVVGAAVGAAFSGIESVSYAIQYSQNLSEMIDIQLTRNIFAAAGHFTYCIPYSTAIALTAKNGRLSNDFLLNKQVLGAFFFAVAQHAVWNSATNYVTLIILCVISASLLLYWVKKALQQIVMICGQQSGHRNGDTHITATNSITLRCTAPSMFGKQITSSGIPILIGRQPEQCNLCFNGNAKGVSRLHCKIFLSNGTWFVQDLNSTYGTYVGNRMLTPYEIRSIQKGDVIYLGSSQNAISVD